MDNIVAVIGSGIIGLTTAALLGALGNRVDLYSERSDLEGIDGIDPAFATGHAAASVIPHSVRSSRASEWTAITQRFLRDIIGESHSGVRINRHMEAFEISGFRLPDYVSALDGVQMVDPGSLPPHWPVRAGARTSGWYFDCVFCDGPVYRTWLSSLLRSMDVKARLGATVTVEGALEQSRANVVFVCAGHRSGALIKEFGEYLGSHGRELPGSLRDDFPIRYILGHYLLADRRDLLLDPTGRVLSYNYTPYKGIYSIGGLAADVYCYPRVGSWLLGGSRISVVGGLSEALDAIAILDEGGMVFPSIWGEYQAVPRAIFELNSSLLVGMTAGKVDLSGGFSEGSVNIRSGAGLRAERSDPAESMKVDAGKIDHPLSAIVAVNYGHGGAGYTLSWGSAVASIARAQRVGADLIGSALSETKDSFASRIRELVFDAMPSF